MDAPTPRKTVPVWASLVTVAVLALAFMAFGYLLRGFDAEDRVGPLEVVEAPDVGAEALKAPSAEPVAPPAAEPDPDDPVDALKRGDDLLAKNSYKEALIAYEQSLKANPGGVDALYGKGRCLIALGSTSEGEAALWSALDRQPGHVKSAVALCRQYVATGRYRSAIVTGRDVLEKVPAQADLEYLVGAGYEGLGQVGTALQWYRAAIVDGGTHPEAQAAVARLGG